MYRPAGKRAFAAVGYPGISGVLSGMNDAGLVVADLTVTAAADGSAALDPGGVPYALALRRVLEECGTVAEAEALLRSLRRTVRQNVAVCDRDRVAVFEVTPKTLAVRGPDGGVCACTNHFRTARLSVGLDDKRYATLIAGAGGGEVLGVGDVAKRMDAVHQGPMTMQAMVFEPAAGRLHVALGYGPVTQRRLRSVDLKTLFPRGAGVE